MQYQCVGFCSIQAKRLGNAFRNTQFILVLNSPRLWIEHHNNRIPQALPSHLVIDHMEAYCAEHADTVFCPSQSLIDWVRDQGWKLASDTRLMPTWTPWEQAIAPVEANVSHLVFFGRLETRKGLEIFCDAISLVASNREDGAQPLSVHLVGKLGAVSGSGAGAYLDDWKARLPPDVAVCIHSELSQEDAMNFLESNRDAIYIFPVTADNSPNALLEAKARGLHVLVADISGCSELLADRQAVFPPDPEGLAAKIREVWASGMPPSSLAVPLVEVERRRLEHLREMESLPLRSETNLEVVRPHRKISVCIPHHNLGPYLDQTLASIKAQTYPNYEVIVVDDGSDDPASLEAFEAASRKYAHKKWQFIRTELQGVCQARNTAASVASGEFLAFVDADDIAHPHMLDTLERSLQAGALDVITCYLYAFDDGASPAPEALSLHFAFVGGCLEAAIFYNTLGNTNMLVRRLAFDAVGGFPSHDIRGQGSEDRALLVRLLRGGFKLDTTTETILSYRLRAASLSRTTNLFFRQLNILDAFLEGQEPWMRRLFYSQFGGKNIRKTVKVSGVSRRAKNTIRELTTKYEAEREKRRERDAKADERYQTLLRWRSHPFVRLARFLRLMGRKF